MFMRLCPLFPALHLYLSDTTRHRAKRTGIEGLRHKSRHKVCGAGRDCPRPIVWGTWRRGVPFVNVLGRAQKKFQKKSSSESRIIRAFCLPQPKATLPRPHDVSRFPACSC